MTHFTTRATAADGDHGSPTTAYPGAERRRRITVLLATNQLALGDLFRPLLERYRAVQFVCALTTSATQIREAIDRRMPRILLLDEALVAMLGASAVSALTMNLPRVRIILVSDRETADVLEMVVRNRFHGILKTTASAELLVKALFKVNRGAYWLPRNLMERALFAPPAAERLDAAIESKLSKREADAVRQLCSGMTNRQIAEALGIREDTVKKHLHKAYSKLGVQNRTHLIACVAAGTINDS